MMKNKNRMYCMLLCALLLLSLLPLQSFAVTEKIDPNHEASLTLSYLHGETVLSGVAFDIYRVAAVSGYGEFSVTDAFDDYSLDFSDMEQSRWAALAVTLKGYVQRDDVAPTASGATDADGKLLFPALETGLYLVLGARTDIGNRSYTAVPFFVCLPSEDAQTGTWNYDPTVLPKSTAEELPPVDETLTLKVLKKWDDTGRENKRPERITVQLLCDGKVYDTVQLSKDNRWSYTWTELEKNHEWTVVEIVPENYTVTLTKSGVTFVLTNKYKGTPPPVPDVPSLPQTGLLWWPVPVLFGAGLLCILLAMLRRRNSKHE